MADASQSIDAILGEEFLTWLWYQSDTAPDFFKTGNGEPFNVHIEQNIVVQGGEGELREKATVSGLPLREARFGLGAGKKVTRALIRLEKGDLAFQFIIKANDFCLGSLRTPKLDKADADDEPDALFLEKLFLIESCLELFDCLYQQFLNLRLSPAWQTEVSNMGKWLNQTE